MDQHTFVAGCLAYYAENYYEPGNPEDGIWEDCHYPVPKCLGGTATIKLLKQHHAVQGVLQSEEYQCPCIFGWEIDYLEGEILDLFNKWLSERARQASKTAWSRLTPEQRSERGRIGGSAYRDNTTPEQRSEVARKGNASRTPEQRSETARKRRAAMTPEQRSEITRKGNETRRLRRLGLLPE